MSLRYHHKATDSEMISLYMGIAEIITMEHWILEDIMSFMHAETSILCSEMYSLLQF